MTKFMECCAVKKQLPEASPSIHLTCNGSSQGKSSMEVVFNEKCSRHKSKYLPYKYIASDYFQAFFDT